MAAIGEAVVLARTRAVIGPDYAEGETAQTSR